MAPGVRCVDHRVDLAAHRRREGDLNAPHRVAARVAHEHDHRVVRPVTSDPLLAVAGDHFDRRGPAFDRVQTEDHRRAFQVGGTSFHQVRARRRAKDVVAPGQTLLVGENRHVLHHVAVARRGHEVHREALDRVAEFVGHHHHQAVRQDGADVARLVVAAVQHNSRGFQRREGDSSLAVEVELVRHVAHGDDLLPGARRGHGCCGSTVGVCGGQRLLDLGTVAARLEDHHLIRGRVAVTVHQGHAEVHHGLAVGWGGRRISRDTTGVRIRQRSHCAGRERDWRAGQRPDAVGGRRFHHVVVLAGHVAERQSGLCVALVVRVHHHQRVGVAVQGSAAGLHREGDRMAFHRVVVRIRDTHLEGGRKWLTHGARLVVPFHVQELGGVVALCRGPENDRRAVQLHTVVGGTGLHHVVLVAGGRTQRQPNLSQTGRIGLLRDGGLRSAVQVATSGRHGERDRVVRNAVAEAVRHLDAERLLQRAVDDARLIVA